MHTLPRPQWANRVDFRHAGSHRRHNHSRQFFCHSVQGFRHSDSQNFTISIVLAGRSYNNVSTAMLHCDLPCVVWHKPVFCQNRWQDWAGFISFENCPPSTEIVGQTDTHTCSQLTVVHNHKVVNKDNRCLYLVPVLRYYRLLWTRNL